MNEDDSYRARILDYAQTLLKTYPQQRRRLKVLLFIFGLLALVIVGITIFRFVEGKSLHDLAASILGSALLTVITLSGWRNYKSLQHYESLCQAIVFLSKDK